MRMRPSHRAVLAAAAPLLLCLGLSAPASAVPLGTQTDVLGTFSTISQPGGAVFTTLEDPRADHHVTAPTDGVITSWRTHEFSGTVTASLVVLERTAGTDDMRAVSNSTPVTAGSSWFGAKTRLPIKAGQQVGVSILSQTFHYFFWNQNVPGGRYAIYDALVPGGAARPPATAATAPFAPRVFTDAVFHVQAVLEPDVDGDGFGDETQDLCPGLANQDQTDTDRDGSGDACDTDDDGDGLLDTDEATHTTDPLNPDSDADGLLDGDEVSRGTNPLSPDTDADSLDDANEVARGTNPLEADSDDDGLEDGDEITRGTDPLIADTDRDGLADGDEVSRGTDPLVADSDADGLDDGDEITRGTDPLVPDSDGDGIDDRTEIALGLDPLNPDSDGDGFADGPDACPAIPGTDGGCPPVVPPAPQLIDRPVPVPVASDQAPTVAFATPSGFTNVAGGSTVSLSLMALDDHGVGTIEVLSRGRVLCRATTAPFVCRIATDGRLVGTNTLVAVARDGAGQVGTATHTLTVRPFRPSAVRSAVTVRGGNRTTVRTRGTIKRPDGLDAASACRGRVTVQIKRGPVTLSSRRVRVTTSCGFRSTVVFGSRVRSGDRLRVQAIFGGNRAVGSRRSATRTVSVPRRPAAAPRNASRIPSGRSVTLSN